MRWLGAKESGECPDLVCKQLLVGLGVEDNESSSLRLGGAALLGGHCHLGLLGVCGHGVCVLISLSGWRGWENLEREEDGGRTFSRVMRIEIA
jgi:hypothetical protein